MFKRRIWILCVIVVLIIMTKHFGESKPKADLAMKPDVVSSISINQDQYLTVVANRSRIEDKEEFADLLIQMYKENSFESMKFSEDEGYPTSLDMNVYTRKEDIGEKDPIMTVEYKPEEWNAEYDIVNATEQFHLYVDDEMVEDN